MATADKIRNLAIVAHVDHGKTTLIDSIFQVTRTFRENARVEERIMDSNELERERGITIRAKHCSVDWKDYRINIVDTPGHADFSGEVERVLSMVDSVLLLVDANEGPMPQTRYVLMRALRLGMKPIVLVNKVDRPNANPQSALEKTFNLFIELGASDEQADFTALYGSGLNGWFVRDLEKDKHEGLGALFETIVEKVAPPKAVLDAPFLLQVSSLGWSDYLGRLGLGRVLQGTLRKNSPIIRTSTRWKGYDQATRTWEITGSESKQIAHLWVTHGLEQKEVDEVSAGDIVWVNGPEDLSIGDTISAPGLPDPALPPLEIEEPTVSMFFCVNNGPFAGKSGRAATIRDIKDRLQRELRVNVALRMEELPGRADAVKVSGRGELHLAILIEEMRREKMEMCVSKPKVITHTGENGEVLEPWEQVIVDTPEAYQGVVMEKLARRKAEITNMENTGTGVVRLEYKIPTRGLIGYRSEFLTDTRGMGILAARFVGYGPWAGEVTSRISGALVSLDTGPATRYAIENLQERGRLFISSGDELYSGMVVGESSRPGDLPCNPTKKRHVTNHRSATKEIDTPIDVPIKHTLDSALEWIADDELVEVTPANVRIRKIFLNIEDRKREEKRVQTQSATA